MVQGIHKEFIFSEDIEKDKYFNLINNRISNYNISMLSYCIMDNHTHLLVHCQDINKLSKLMSCVNTSYAKWYNHRKTRVGYVFRDRFLSQSISNYGHLYNCIYYIHNNPVKANIVKNPNEYKYSSYNDYINKCGIYSPKLLDLLSLTLNNYLSVLTRVSSPILLKEDSLTQITPESIIYEYIRNHNLQIDNLLSNSLQLKELITDLRIHYHLTITDISNFFKIPRGRIYRLLK